MLKAIHNKICDLQDENIGLSNKLVQGEITVMSEIKTNRMLIKKLSDLYGWVRKVNTNKV